MGCGHDRRQRDVNHPLMPYPSYQGSRSIFILTAPSARAIGHGSVNVVPLVTVDLAIIFFAICPTQIC
jgi:hypothetical protein